MNMEFKRKLPIPAEIKEMYPISEEGMKAKKLNDQKLYDISAENFALHVYQFYLDKIISNNQYLSQKGESIPRQTARLFRQAPGKTVKTVVRTPKKVAIFAKKAIKHAQILKKYGKIKLK